MQFQEIIWLVLTLNMLYQCSGASTDSQGNYFLNAAKNVPRIGRSNNKNTNIDEMGKFFMKASKSVPRIGRRNENFGSPYEDPNQPYQEYQDTKHIDKRIRYNWVDLADHFEYEPELFNSPEFIWRYEEALGDDPNVYETDKMRVKRNPKLPLF